MAVIVILSSAQNLLGLVKEQSKTRPLVLIGGFIHDLSSFMNHHPGGQRLLSSNIGNDATTAFLGGIYEHSHAAHNVRPLSISLERENFDGF